MTVSDDIVYRVLDELSVTDTVYHDLAYTRPLIVHLLDAVTGRPQRGRTLLVGPNIALAQALVDKDWPIEIWHVPGVTITEDMRANVTRVGDLDTLFGEDVSDDTYDVIVLPFVLDAALADPSALLRTVRRMTRPTGPSLSPLVVLARSRRGCALWPVGPPSRPTPAFVTRGAGRALLPGGAWTWTPYASQRTQRAFAWCRPKQWSMPCPPWASTP